MELSYILLKSFVLISNDDTMKTIVLPAKTPKKYDAEISYFGEILAFVNVYTILYPDIMSIRAIKTY